MTEPAIFPISLPFPEPDTGKHWKPRMLLKEPVPGIEEMSCHISALMPGQPPHEPHRHPEEETLLLLSGELELILPELYGDERKRLSSGELIYYPADCLHTIKSIGINPANYLIFKWGNPMRAANGHLKFEKFDLIVPRIKSMGSHRVVIFDSPTQALSKFHCHVSTLAPSDGYEPHVDDYTVAILVLSGRIETVGQTATPHTVIIYPAGTSHGLKNLSTTEIAQYLVFEFHP